MDLDLGSDQSPRLLSREVPQGLEDRPHHTASMKQFLMARTEELSEQLHGYYRETQRRFYVCAFIFGIPGVCVLPLWV